MRTGERKKHKKREKFFQAIFIAAIFFFTAKILFAAQIDADGDLYVPGTFKDIPGITAEEIRAVEEVLVSKDHFTYGMVRSIEAFSRKDGSVGGYGANMCEWLSGLFGVPFGQRLVTRRELAEGLQSGAIDFSGDFSPLDDELDKFIMTTTISERIIKSARLKGAQSLEAIGAGRPVRYGFLLNSTGKILTLPYLESGKIPYVSQTEDDQTTALGKLRNGEIDILIAESTIIDQFNISPDIETANFSPLLFKQVSLSTTNPQLKPIIGALDKYLRQGGLRYLHQLRDEGNAEYNRAAFTESLSAAELAWHQERLASEQPIPYGITSNNYPVSFYNKTTKQWDGIAADVLKEISRITGLAFRPANAADATWPAVYGMFDRGETPMAAELLHTPARAERFAWAAKANNTDRYALVSKKDLKNLSVNEILYSRVGLQENTGHAAKFLEWFPDHTGTFTYSTLSESLKALEDGEVSLLMMSESRFLSVANYMERPDFKINLVFSESLDSRFAFQPGETVLRGVIDKAMALIDTGSIASSWNYRMYDYRTDLVRTHVYFILSLSVLFFVAAAFFVWTRFRRREMRAAEQNERELRAARDAAEASARGKSEFLALMSHEMRTPMNAITGFSELLIAEAEENRCAGDCPGWLGKINNASMTLLSIINDILDISKIESGKFEIIPAEYDLPSLINDTVTLNITRIGDKPVRFILDIDESLPCKLSGDELRVKQICNNLLSNAFKYTKEGAVTWKLTCEKADADNNADGESVWMTITVRDTGIGIREKDIQKLFSSYSQVDTRSNRSIEGTGLGLSLTKNLAELMDGSISVESVYGEGSSFTVKIRQKFVTDTPIGPEVAAGLCKFRHNDNKRVRHANLKRTRMPYAKVLLVDDLRVNLEVALGMMKPYGMQIDCVTSGLEAVEAVRREEVRYSAIFMDQMMPVMDGLEATRIIRQEIGTDYAKNVPIIVLTANAIVGNEEMCLASGCQAFLSKPIDIMRLDQVMQQWVRDKSLENSLGILMEGAGNENRSGQEEQAYGSGAYGSEAHGNEVYGSEAYGNEVHESNAHESRLRRWQISGLDLDEALEKFGGDEPLLRVLRVFAEDTPALLEQIRRVTQTSSGEVRDEILDDYIITIHGIKGSCRGISAFALSALAEKLEQAARAGEFGYVEAHNAEFIQNANTLVENLRNMLGSEMVKYRKSAPDRRLLEAMKDSAKSFDVDGLYDAITELELFEYDEGGELVRLLRENVRTLDFKKIAEQISLTLK